MSFKSYKKYLIAIPARLKSSRLPNKVLEVIGNKPMIRHVLDRCNKFSDDLSVNLCTDSEKLFDMASSWGFNVIKTDKNCLSGTERIASVLDKLVGFAWNMNLSDISHDAKENIYMNTCIINVQGDQPFIDSNIILSLKKYLSTINPSADIVTPVYQLDKKNIHNPNIVKTLLAQDGRAIYFSRSAVPHIRDIKPEEWSNHYQYWGHVGIYGYRATILSKWNLMPLSSLEKLERLEQLRLIDAGYTISTFPVDSPSLSVDTYEQLEEARALANTFPDVLNN